MRDAGRHRGAGGAADDVLGALSLRVRELQSKVASLQAELDEAQRRLGAYEDFDTQIQEALSAALKSAYEIRARAEETANQIVEQGREERRVLMKEVQRLRDERDTVQDEIATLRRGGLAPVPKSAPAPEAPSPSDLRAAAADAMRSVFDEILPEMRGGAPASQPAAPAQPQYVPTEYTPPPPRRAPERAVPPPPPPAPPPRVQAPAPRPAAPPPAAPPPSAAPQPSYMPPAAAAAPPSPPAPSPLRQPPPALAPQPPVVREVPIPREAPQVREVAPAPPPPVETRPAPAPVPPAPPRQQPAAAAPDARLAAESAAPSTEIQLVLSPVPSFPRLVEIERRIQSLPGVRTLYVRDFRNGVATLAVGLRSPMTAEEFGAAVLALETPRFHVESVARSSVELRIESEAQTA